MMAHEMQEPPSLSRRPDGRRVESVHSSGRVEVNR
jgi:hypothetical protein